MRQEYGSLVRLKDMAVFGREQIAVMKKPLPHQR
jgi:hypothetical protein